MNKQIKTLLSVALTSLLVTGCATSTSTPWSNENSSSPWDNRSSEPEFVKYSGDPDSPWSDKRNNGYNSDDTEAYEYVVEEEPALLESTVVKIEDGVVTQEALAPVFTDENLPMLEQSAVEVVAMPPMASDADEDVILSAASGTYVSQMYASKNQDGAEAYRDQINMPNALVVHTITGAGPMFVLVTPPSSKTDAIADGVTFEEETGMAPWLRSVSGMKKAVIR